MGKIKGWTKVEQDYWKSNKKEIIITQINDWDKEYAILINNRQYDNVFRNLEDARKSAINYMRSYPNG